VTDGLFTGNRKKSLDYRTCELDSSIGAGVSHMCDYMRISFDEPTAFADHDQLLIEAAGKARSGALMLLVEIAEAKKTVALVREAVATVQKRVHHVTRVTKGRYKHLLKAHDIYRAFGDTWLEARYGWNQMIYSTSDALDAYVALQKPKEYIVTGRSWAGSPDAPISVVQMNISRHKKAQSVYSIADHASNNIVKRATVAVKIRNGSAAVDHNLAAFGWEIVPYSFVVDWFVNLGDLFRAHWPNPGISGQVACRSTKRTVLLNRVVSVGTASNCGNVHGSTPLLVAMGMESYSRDPVEAIPFSLTWRPRLGWEQIVDAVALLPTSKGIASIYRRLRV
jgi:hypothetical protein